MTKKRPIDIQRDSAGHLDVGTPDDESAITDVFSIGGSLYVIKEKGIYQVKLADEIDPKRTNPKVPNTHQRILAYGSDNEIVGHIFLTAKHLFDPAYLGRSFDHERALALTFDALKDLLAMHEILMSIEEAEARAKASYSASRGKGGALGLPSVGDLTPQGKSYIQKAHHALKALLAIVKVFYGTNAASARFQALAKLAEDRYGKVAHSLSSCAVSYPLCNSFGTCGRASSIRSPTSTSAIEISLWTRAQQPFYRPRSRSFILRLRNNQSR